MSELATLGRPLSDQVWRSAPRRAELVWQPAGLAFIASCATLVIELLAGRMMAPVVGVSLYTWTSIIGVVLAGVSLGSWLGGRLADRCPSWRVLGGLFLVAGLCTLGMLFGS